MSPTLAQTRPSSHLLALSILSVALLAALSHSTPVDAGSAFGHPVPWDLAPGAGLTFNSGWLHVDHALVDRCDGTVDTLSMDLDIPLGGDVPLIEGDLCGLELVLDGPVEVWGTGNGGSFSLTLDLGSIDFTLAAGVDQVQDLGGLELASPGWVTASLLGLSPTNDVDVDSLHSLHDDLVDEIDSGSTAHP